MISNAQIRSFVKDSFRLAFDLRSWIAGFKALRVPSLVIAAFSCSLGVVMAWRDGHGDLLNSIAVIIAGLALQAGVNLVNDFFEFRQGKVDDKVAGLGFSRADRDLLEWLVFLVGLAFFGLTGLIGLFLVWRTGWPLFVLGVVGFFGGFFYTGEPLNYKRRGLAVPLVFFLMGVFMVAGSYYAVTGIHSWTVVFASIPVSILVSLILLANELRDYEADARHGIRTLSVRVGYRNATILYCCLLLAAYCGPLVLWRIGILPHPWLVYLALPFTVPPFIFIRKPAERRFALIPLVMLHHLAFGVLFCGVYFL
jgi:1,4-dihydroxy-2-naphthoate polyprenyltransferase